MVWGPQWRWSHTTIKHGLLYGLHSSVPVHVVNLYQNKLTHVTVISSAPKLLIELRFGSNSFDRKSFSNILKLDLVKKPYLKHNTRISGNAPSDIGEMNGLMELYMSFISLHGNTTSSFYLLKEHCSLVMDETHIHGPTPADLDNMTLIIYLYIKSFQATTQFYDFQSTSSVVLGFTHISILMLKGWTKYLSSYQVYFSCKIPSMSLHDISNHSTPYSYLHDHYIWFINNN